MQKKTPKRKQIAKILKKHNTWIGILFFLLIAFLAFAIWSGLVSAFVYYIAESKVMGEYKVISYMAELYEKTGSVESFEDLPDMETRDYIVTDRNGNVLYQRGEDTRGEVNAYLEFLGGSEPVKATADQSTNFFYTDEKGEMDINFSLFIPWFLSDDLNSFVKKENGNSNFYFPLWLEKDIRNVSEVFYGKAYAEVLPFCCIIPMKLS